MAHGGDGGSGTRASVTFPIPCEYRGGNTALGRHGKHLWIADGRIGHGELKLTHDIALSDVRSVEVTERMVGGADITIVAMPGLPLTRQVPGAAPRQVTEVTVRTADGQQALWLIRNRGADWTKARLGPALQEAGIPFFEDLLPADRPPDP